MAARMEEVTGAEMYVLGDTTYGRWVSRGGDPPQRPSLGAQCPPPTPLGLSVAAVWTRWPPST